MNVIVNIYTPDEDIGCSITIEHIKGTDNYDYVVKGDIGGADWTGTIYNHDSDYIELVKKVLNGRNLSR